MFLLLQRLTLVINGFGNNRAEHVFPAIVQLQAALETQAHHVHVHVLDALGVTG